MEGAVHIISNFFKKGLEALISGRISKVASKDLFEGLEGEKGGNRTEMTLWPGISSVVGTPFSVTGAGGASDMVRGTILDAGDEQGFEPVFVEQLDGLRREGRPAVRTLNTATHRRWRQSKNHHGRRDGTSNA